MDFQPSQNWMILDDGNMSKAQLEPNLMLFLPGFPVDVPDFQPRHVDFWSPRFHPYGEFFASGSNDTNLPGDPSELR